MQERLGARIGEGATADVHLWAPGQVIKLFKDGVPERLCTHEARTTRAVAGAGGLAPDVVGVISHVGRPGIIMTRLDGPTLLDALRTGATSSREAGGILAGCLISVHRTPPPPDLLPLRVYMAGSLRRAGDLISDASAADLLALIDRLSPGDGLCHGDPNPGNVILTADGPRLIDWIAALRAPATLDLASAHVILAELAPQLSDDPERPRAVNRALQAAYADLAGIDPASAAAAVADYLPVARALLALGGAVPALASQLIASLNMTTPA